MAHPSSAKPSCKSVQSFLPSLPQPPQRPSPQRSRWGMGGSGAHKVEHQPCATHTTICSKHQTRQRWCSAVGQQGHWDDQGVAPCTPEQQQSERLTWPTSQFCLAKCKSALNSISFAERKGRVNPYPSLGVLIFGSQAINMSVSLLLAGH